MHMYDSAGAPVAYGATPVADFTNNRQIKLNVTIGRVYAGVSPSHALGTFTGAETYLLLPTDVSNHTHTNANGAFVSNSGGGNNLPTNPGNWSASAQTGDVARSVAQTAFSLMQPTTYMNIYIKL